MEINFDGSESSGSEVVPFRVVGGLETLVDGLVSSWAFSEVVGKSWSIGGCLVDKGSWVDEFLVLPVGRFYTSQRYLLKSYSTCINYLTGVAGASFSAENLISSGVESINFVKVTSLIVALPGQFFFSIV